MARTCWRVDAVVEMLSESPQVRGAAGAVGAVRGCEGVFGLVFYSEYSCVGTPYGVLLLLLPTV
eukprot:1673037-Prymnesium_polylepis.1